MSEQATPDHVAEWMVEQLNRDFCLYQDTAVYAIADKFGHEFTYTNANGNLAIRKDILAAFRKLTGEGVIWERGSRAWRKRQDYDQPGRQQL